MSEKLKNAVTKRCGHEKLTTFENEHQEIQQIFEAEEQNPLGN